MKKITFLKAVLLAIVLVMGSMHAWGQGNETFTKSDLAGLYDSGSFLGDNNFAWNYVDARNESTYAITGKGLMFKGELTAKLTSASFSGGIGTFNCSLKKAFTADGKRQVELFINGVSKGTSMAWDNTTVQRFSVPNINIAGNIIIEIRNKATKQVTVDDISWTSYPASSCTPSTLAFTNATVNKTSTDPAFTMAPATNSLAAITYTSSVGAVATVNAATGQITIIGAGTTIIIASQAANATYCAASVDYTLNVGSTIPIITVTEASIPGMKAYVGASDAETVTVTGVKLTGNISVSIINDVDNQFNDPSVSTISRSGDNTASASVTVTYKPSITGAHTATLKVESAGAVAVTRTLSGSASIPGVVPNVIITEVYGGGGNSGATYRNDFIELYNTTESSIDMGGWSVQYYTAAGNIPSTNMAEMPAGKSIGPNKYFLIQANAGSGGTADLPTPDAICNINLSATAGKIILYTTTTAQAISDIVSITRNANFKDYVAFGTATPIWGTDLGAASNTKSASRKMLDGVYLYTPNLGLDFEIVAPEPQNSGITTLINARATHLDILAMNGQIVFTSPAGMSVEVYNAMGQKLLSRLTVDGLNSMPVAARGVVFVRLGDRVTKVIL